VRSRNTSWWDGDAQDLDDAEFRSYFRMVWSAFYALADDLKPDVQLKDTRYRKAVDYEAVVAMALYRLATGAADLLTLALRASSSSLLPSQPSFSSPPARGGPSP
jgi:hypothetical protein